MNGFRQIVTLDGGPFDGDTRLVDRAVSVVTIEYQIGVRLRDYGAGDELVRVPLLDYVTYRRSSPNVFTFCREVYQPEEGGDMSEVQPEPVEETEEEETVEETVEEPATAPATEPEGELEF